MDNRTDYAIGERFARAGCELMMPVTSPNKTLADNAGSRIRSATIVAFAFLLNP